MAKKNGNEMRKSATLIGVNHYLDNGISDLRCSTQDVTSLDRILTDPNRGRFKDVQMLTDAVKEELLQPTAANVRESIRNLARTAGEDDFIWVFFSGHGQVEDGEAFLVPRDARLGTLAETAIPLEWIKEEIKKSRARFKLLTLDACHAGAQLGKEQSKGMDDEFAKGVFDNAGGLAILSSCKRNELSWEMTGEDHSVFSYYLLEGLDGRADTDNDGLIGATELNKFVFSEVQRWAIRSNKQQTPTFQGEYSGEIHLVAVPEDYKRPAPATTLKVSKETDLVTSFYLVAEMAATSAKNGQKQLMGKVIPLCSSFDDCKSFTRKIGDTTYCIVSFPFGMIRVWGGILEAHFCKLGKVNYAKIREVLSAVELPWDGIGYVLRCRFELKSLLKSLEALGATPTEYDVENQTVECQIEGWGRDAQPATVYISNHALGARVRVIQRTAEDKRLLERNFHLKLGVEEFTSFFKEALKAAEVTGMAGNFPINWLVNRHYAEAVIAFAYQQYPVMVTYLRGAAIEFGGDGVLAIKLNNVDNELSTVLKKGESKEFFRSLALAAFETKARAEIKAGDELFKFS